MGWFHGQRSFFLCHSGGLDGTLLISTVDLWLTDINHSDTPAAGCDQLVTGFYIFAKFDRTGRAGSINLRFPAHLFDRGFLLFGVDPPGFGCPTWTRFDTSCISVMSLDEKIFQLASGFRSISLPGSMVPCRDHQLTVTCHSSTRKFFQFSESKWRQAQCVNIDPHLHRSLNLVHVLPTRTRSCKKRFLNCMSGNIVSHAMRCSLNGVA